MPKVLKPTQYRVLKDGYNKGNKTIVALWALVKVQNPDLKISHGQVKLFIEQHKGTVPKITVILRKAYGGAYCVMSSKHLRGDINYAWPQAEIAVMGPKGAIEVLRSKQIAGLPDDAARAEFVANAEAEYKKEFANPYNAARYGYIDDVIEPRNTRFRIIRALQSLATKKDTMPAKKHSNLPL